MHLFVYCWFGYHVYKFVHLDQSMCGKYLCSQSNPCACTMCFYVQNNYTWPEISDIWAAVRLPAVFRLDPNMSLPRSRCPSKTCACIHTCTHAILVRVQNLRMQFAHVLKMVDSGSKRARWISDYKQLNAFSSVVLYDAVRKKKKLSKLY